MSRFADPFLELERAFHQMDRAWSGGIMPMDAYTTLNTLHLTFDIPGVNLDSIDMSVERNVISVTVERPVEDTEGVTWAVRERPTGRHTRQIRVSDGVDLAKANASYEDGVLTVTMPLHDDVMPRKIDVHRALELA